ncbi:replication initiator protein [Capybara microvirus Cap3_SP_472]|nr:replication initiator protein [Capybara microvirus Cap3_SP_472]
MGCKKPKIIVQDLNKWKTAADGHKYHPAECNYASEEDINTYKDEKIKIIGTHKYSLVPCGQCLGCRLQRSAEWADRCTLEMEENPEQCWFLTLTYNDENLPYIDEFTTKKGITYTDTEGTWNGCLQKKDIQDFLKRLRRRWEYKYSAHNIRTFYCGEYGPQTERPHYHMICFNLPITPDMMTIQKLNWEKDILYKCDEIEQIWGKGFVVIEECNWQACNYVARYITKKQTGKLADEYYAQKGQIPPFVQASLKPAIGKNYYQENKSKIYENDNIIITGKGKVLKIKPPRYFDKLYDLDYPSDMLRIKKLRERKAMNGLLLKTQNTSLDYLEQLKIEEDYLTERTTTLKRTNAEA